jgi:hypothetical protein
MLTLHKGQTTEFAHKPVRGHVARFKGMPATGRELELKRAREQRQQ